MASHVGEADADGEAAAALCLMATLVRARPPPPHTHTRHPAPNLFFPCSVFCKGGAGTDCAVDAATRQRE